MCVRAPCNFSGGKVRTAPVSSLNCAFDPGANQVKCLAMSSQSTSSSSNPGEKASLVQIGHYVLGETLGIGTFGKVKGKFQGR